VKLLNVESSQKTISVTVNDKKLELPSEATVNEVAEELDASDVVGARINGEIQDLRDPLNDGDTVRLLTFNDDDGKDIFWHTSAHVLAQAVQMYFDKPVNLGTGPPVEEGFYYDFKLPRSLSEDELEHIENIMRQLIKQDLSLERFDLEGDEAVRHLREINEPFKVELAEELEEKPSFYRQEGFEDLCKGPHLESTGEIEAVSLTKLSGSYCRGDENKKKWQLI
jgi:threonyl-tRNA synthetase